MKILLTIILAAIATESSAQSAKSYFEYNYSYEVRTACRELAGRGRQANYNRSISCANNLVAAKAKAKSDKAWNDYLRSAQMLNEKLARN